jgi:farnesyl-diphosphate farnesyltransferase
MRLENHTSTQDQITHLGSALEVLEETSRTFYPSIVSLPAGLREAVMSAYLSLRAIDEIEDNPQLNRLEKIELLSEASSNLRRLGASPLFTTAGPALSKLPEVTRRLSEWIDLAPPDIAPRICRISAAMARRMRYWVANDWRIRTEHDLDRYTFSVAGAVGVLLSDLWKWFDGTVTERAHAVGFGRGLQAVNILRNRSEDLRRGVDFFPDGWTRDDLQSYARQNLSLADRYVEALAAGPIKTFCSAPLALAYATLDVLASGEPKLSRPAVLGILEQGQDHLHERGSKKSCSERGVVTNPGRHEEVILVNERDQVLGVEEKIKAHVVGALHRAFSVFVFNSAGHLLIQERARTKYHSKGLWSNTCCGHPRITETTEQASRRRLNEEMGIDCELREVFAFMYRAKLDDDLFEHEYDHVLVGTFDGEPCPNSEEVDNWKWAETTSLKLDIKENPQNYTYWFRISLETLCSSFSFG